MSRNHFYEKQGIYDRRYEKVRAVKKDNHIVFDRLGDTGILLEKFIMKFLKLYLFGTAYYLVNCSKI